VNESQFPIWKELFSAKYFVVHLCKNLREVELCGALKVKNYKKFVMLPKIIARVHTLAIILGNIR